MNLSTLVITALFLCPIVLGNEATDIAKPKRQGKLFPVFQIIKFNNDPCVGTSSRNGSCYTAAECTSKGGKNSGNCASGYGVCCTFDKGCGASTTENCTYFSPTSTNAGVCTLEVCPCNSNICQLRLDFAQFVISGPSTLTGIVGGLIFNNLVSKSGSAVSTSGQCLTDTFSVTNPGGETSPVICGTNTGQHLYVDSSKECNDLVFQLGNAGVGTTIATRAWSIKVSQYSCDYNNLAPEGCTQYFYGSNSAAVQSFNYNSGAGQQLANQDQTICVRRERGQCRICWSQTTNADFSVSGVKTLATGKVVIAVGRNNPSVCCGYGTNGMVMMGFDCVEIPGAKNVINVPVPSRICGMMLVTISGAATSATVCSAESPFSIRAVTDQYEYLVEVMKPNKGFMLVYTQDAINCI